LLDQLGEGDAANPRRGPQEHLCGAVIADHLRLDMGRVDAEVSAEMNAKALTIEIGASAQHGSMWAHIAGHIG